MSQFRRGGNHLVNCDCCKKLTHSNSRNIWGVDMCPTCVDSAEQRNGHSDNGDHDGKYADICPDCAGVDCMHQLKEKVA